VKIPVNETDDFTTGKETLNADVTYVKQIAKELKNYNI
jgi:hypothetical protein